MKLSFRKEDLVNAIQTVQSAVSTKSTLPVLSNFLIGVGKFGREGHAGVRIEATDLEVGVKCGVKAEIVKEGRITVPAKRFAELVREMPGDKEIEISAGEGRRVELRCGKVRATLQSIAAEDFPTIPEFPEKKALELSKKTFREMIQKSAFAVSTDETRYVLNGILFQAGGGELKMVATDGRRLAYISRDGQDPKLSANVIIPAKAIAELLRLLALDDAADSLRIAPHENQISFRWQAYGEEITLVSRVIDGTFPNYDQVIPKGKEVELKVRTPEILAAIRRAALFAQDRGGSVRLSLSKGSLKVSANSQGIGEEEEELNVDYGGADFDIAFNPVFVADVLKNSDSPETVFEFTTPLNPGLIKPAGNDRYLCVVMPMRLQ